MNSTLISTCIGLLTFAWLVPAYGIVVVSSIHLPNQHGLLAQLCTRAIGSTTAVTERGDEVWLTAACCHLIWLEISTPIATHCFLIGAVIHALGAHNNRSGQAKAAENTRIMVTDGTCASGSKWGLNWLNDTGLIIVTNGTCASVSIWGLNCLNWCQLYGTWPSGSK